MSHATFEEQQKTIPIDESRLSYVSDAAGARAAVIIPIDLWSRIREALPIRTVPPLVELEAGDPEWMTPAYKQRLLDAMKSTERVPFDEALRRLGMTREELDAVD